MKKIIIALVMAVCLVGFVGPAKAISLTADDLIGTVLPGSPATEILELGRLNQLITMNNTGTPTSPYTLGDYTYTLVVGSNVPVTLVEAFGGFKITAAEGVILESVTTPYMYLMAKFGNKDAFYYLGGQTGSIESLFIPTAFGPRGNGLSHITLFNPTSVPEPATLILMGLGLLGVAGFRRKK